MQITTYAPEDYMFLTFSIQIYTKGLSPCISSMFSAIKFSNRFQNSSTNLTLSSRGLYFSKACMNSQLVQLRVCVTVFWTNSCRHDASPGKETKRKEDSSIPLKNKNIINSDVNDKQWDVTQTVQKDIETTKMMVPMSGDPPRSCCSHISPYVSPLDLAP